MLELAEKRAGRVAYSQNNLEIRIPLPEHEFDKEIIGDMVKILLEELEINRECYGSTTFKSKDMAAGIEPNNCFYIQNYRLAIGKRRLDLTVDPPPDLAIEVDVTSKTQLSQTIICHVERSETSRRSFAIAQDDTRLENYEWELSALKRLGQLATSEE